jgi:hypothetical protein
MEIPLPLQLQLDQHFSNMDDDVIAATIGYMHARTDIETPCHYARVGGEINLHSVQLYNLKNLTLIAIIRGEFVVNHEVGAFVTKWLMSKDTAFMNSEQKVRPMV